MAQSLSNRSLDPGQPFRWDWSVTGSVECVTLTGLWATLPLDLRWARVDPFAVTLVFRREAHRPVEWVLALGLLAEGLTGAIGAGDIDVRPLGGEWVIVGLRAPNGEEVVLALSREGVENFLDAVGEQIPPDIDTMIDVDLRGILTRDKDGKGDPR